MSLPGLLQTESYVRATFARAHRRRSRKQLDTQVKVRLIRQERLTSEENPLQMAAVIDEAALRRDFGAPTVLREQLRFLVDMAQLPAVSLHVLPLQGGPLKATVGAFTVLEFPEPDEEDMLYHEYVTGALHIEKEEEVREARLMFDTLRGEALNQADSVALIERLASLQTSS